jgi:hypothetical protein
MISRQGSNESYGRRAERMTGLRALLLAMALCSAAVGCGGASSGSEDHGATASPAATGSVLTAVDTEDVYRLEFSLPRLEYKTTDPIEDEARLTNTDIVQRDLFGPAGGVIYLRFEQLDGPRMTINPISDMVCAEHRLKAGESI